MFKKWTFKYHYRIRSFCRLTHYPERSWSYGPFGGMWIEMEPNEKGYFTSLEDAQWWFDNGMKYDGALSSRYPRYIKVELKHEEN